MALPLPPLGDLHHVRGRQLALYAGGPGGTPVVFLPGAGQVGLDYLNIQRRVAERTTAVLYDRAGTGWSSPAPLPRSAAEVARELHDLLHTAHIRGPYLLVGHSLGGAYARRFAQLFPHHVAGLLLLDPFHEDLLTRTPQSVRDALAARHNAPIPELTAAQTAQVRAQAAPVFANWPDSVRDPLIDHHATAAWKAGLFEDRNLYTDVADELRHGGPLPDVPTLVLTALGSDDTQSYLWDAAALEVINTAKCTLHRGLAESVPRGRHLVLSDAGHGWLHEQRPDVIVHAVHELLAQGLR